jgi:PAS domain-containing protein
MGSALEVGKLVCASWLKANWERAPRFMKYYMVIAVVVLMLITSMGIFGFLSKAHNDQTLVSGDVASKIAVYDEKIKTERENIDANRKILKQLDESVDQVMGRSQDEKGAEKAVAIRKVQQKERGRIAQDITESQKKITALNEERAPIAAEVRKVEAEVGPIKYIAAFIYGTAPDESMLERAVTWIIILIVVVFDPLAVIMLLAAQMTFGWRNESSNEGKLIQDRDGTIIGVVPTYVADVGEPPTVEELEEIHTEEVPSETLPTALGGDITAPEEPEVPHTTESELEKWNKMIEEAEKEVLAQTTTVEQRVAKGETYIDNEGKEITLEVDLPVDESKKKTYMIKDDQGQIQVKDR